MNKTLTTIIVLIMVVILGCWYFSLAVHDQEETALVSDPVNTTYLIDGESFTLVNGHAEKEIAPGSATKNSVSIFGEPAFGDIDGDGDADAVVLLVNDPGGSGIFYYAAIAVNIDGEYKGTDAILLGDRIVPQTFRVNGNKAEVNYAVRASGEDFSVAPSIGKRMYLQFNPETLQLIQVEINFEGEADPNVMTIGMQTWKWVKTTYNNDTEIAPKDPEAFTITFNSDEGTFFATTDCNAIHGGYEIDDKKIAFKDSIATLMFCEDSQEREFSSMLNEVRSFLFTSRGELVLELKFDTGSMIFR